MPGGNVFFCHRTSTQRVGDVPREDMIALNYDTGVVVKMTSDSGEVFVVVDNVCRLFSFSRGMFYILGKRCVLDMTEALEFGMNVNVCYKYSDGRPFLVAVWIGDMPDSIGRTECVYYQRGVVSYVTVEHLVVRNTNDRSCAFISKDVVFPCGGELAVSKGDRVFYDAYKKGQCKTYEGTCAWFEGNEPLVYDRFFRWAEKHLLTDEMLSLVCGFVSVIPNDEAAIVDVETNSGSIKVLLLRKNFEGDISVGDMLSMRLDYGLVDGISVWFAIEACKDGVEIMTWEENVKRFQEAELDEEDYGEPESKVGAEPESKDCADSEFKVGAEEIIVKAVAERPFGILCGDSPFTGVIERSSEQSLMFFIYYKDTKIHVDRTNVYVDGEVCPKSTFLQMVDSRVIVNFEAVLSTRFGSSLDITHDATCVWVGEKPSFTEIVSQLPRSKLYLLKEKNRVFQGIVIKLFLPDVAFVELCRERSLACLPVTAFGHEKGQWITYFVQLNDRVTCTLGTLPEYPDMLCTINVNIC